MEPADWPESPGVRFLAHWNLRKDSGKLCPGVKQCEYSNDIDRCEKCGLIALEESMNTPKGQLLNQAAELRIDIKLGIHITPEDIPINEYKALIILEQAEHELVEEQNQNGSR